MKKICFKCFKIKGDYEVCPYCGYAEGMDTGQDAYQLPLGVVLQNRYIIGTVLGFGGFGIIYKAYDQSMGIVVAIKELYPVGLVNRAKGEREVGIFSGEKEKEFLRRKERFLEEAKNMAAFSSEKDIINIYNCFEENKTAYIVMEYVEHPLLKNRLKQSPALTVDEVITYMQAILQAIDKIHRHGIIHRDISPDNIFLTGPDTVKIFDFGAARFQGADSRRWEDIVVKGGYAPPEQYNSKGEQGNFMDVYAAGAVFYEMLTGVKPQEAPDRTIEDTLQPPSEINPAVDKRIDRIILKAMALHPELRFQTADQFCRALTDGRNYDEPEVEQKKRRIRRRITIAASIGMPVLVLAVFLIFHQIHIKNQTLDVASIREDKIRVWLVDQTKDKELSELLKKNMQKECDRIEVDVELIPEEDYADRLSEAAKKKQLPEVFCSDYLNKDDAAYCADLTKLYQTLDASEYLFLSDLKKEGKVDSLPLAWQIGVIYQNETKDKDGELHYADEEDIMKAFGDKDSEVARIAGDLSDIDAVRKVTVEQIPSIDFGISPYLEKDHLVGCYTEEYAVSDQADANKQKAGMLVLSILLNDSMQGMLCMQQDNAMPVNRSVYQEYQEYKMTTYLSFLTKYDPEETIMKESDDMCDILRKEESDK